jgi:hypothetical protein
VLEADIVQYYIWTEKSFENEYHLTMTNIDISKIDEQHPERILGPPNNIILNEFIIKNEYLCHYKNDIQMYCS